MKFSLNNINQQQIQIIITIILMAFSILVPYKEVLSVIYQLIIVIIIGVMLLFFGPSASIVLPIITLSTTRSYIAVSTEGEFINYFVLNSKVMFIIMMILLFFILRSRKFRIPYKNGIFSLLLLSLLFILSHLWAINLLEYVKYFYVICLIYITFPLIITNDLDIFMSKFSFTIAGLFGALGILPHMLIFGNIYKANVLVDRNYQACFFLICTLQTVSLLIDRNIRWNLLYKAICLLTVFLDSYIIVVGASRTAFLSLIISGIIYFLLNIKRFKKFILISIILGIMILFLARTGIFDFVLERFTLSNVSTGNGRKELWINYLNGYLEGNFWQILLGRGLVGQTFYGKAAHNLFISILYSFGGVGFLLIMNVIYNCIHNTIRTKNSHELVSIIPILFMCCSIEPYYRIEFAVYIALLVGITNYYVIKEKRYEKYI